ncbi:collagen alpha-1(xiv) chain [Biomphalaria glabrata]|nr:hypothetical protein BgiMline_029998 [Biomphalaria glabrata]
MGFLSLLIGYSSPYWTLVIKSTGETVAMGLVVSCHSKGCVMLHVSEVRSLFVIVFGISTAAVLLSVFVLQVSGLAICNQSCRVRNIGTGLSYFSFFISLLNGATLALYHLDMSLEKDPGYSVVAIGWSQYCLISSSLLYLTGAFLNIADYVKRNMSVHVEDWLFRDTEADLVQKSGPQRKVLNDSREYISSETKPGLSTFKTAVKKVDAAVRIASTKGNSNFPRDDIARTKTNEKIFMISHSGTSNGRLNNVISDRTFQNFNRKSSTNKIERSCLSLRNVDSEDMSVMMPSMGSNTIPIHQNDRCESLATPAVHSNYPKLEGGERVSLKCVSNGKSKLKPGKNDQNNRRGSAVEEALLTVSHLLDNAGNRSNTQPHLSEASVSNDSATLELTPRHNFNKENDSRSQHTPGHSRFAQVVRKYSQANSCENKMASSSQECKENVCNSEAEVEKCKHHLWSEDRVKRLHVMASMKSRDRPKRKILE